MNRPLLVQRVMIVLVLVLALALAVAAILSSSTSPTVKVIVIGVLTGLLAGGLYAAAKSGPSGGQS